MTIGTICSREVDTASPDEPIRTATQRMANRGVGTLVVIDGEGVAAGILTDRDVALRVVGTGRDPDSTTVDDVMTTIVHTGFEDLPVESALGLMRAETVRRLVVVSRSGKVLGIVSLDDIVSHLARELRSVDRLLSKEDPRRALSNA